MPFGLKNAPAVFQSFINSVLRPFLDKSVILYLDDILIFSDNLEDHNKTVRAVFQKLIDNNLFAKLSKCEFDKDKVEFLGHIISDLAFLPIQRKLNQLLNGLHLKTSRMFKGLLIFAITIEDL